MNEINSSYFYYHFLQETEANNYSCYVNVHDPHCFSCPDAQLRKGVSFSLQNSTFPGVSAMAEMAFNSQRIAICGSSYLLDKLQLLIRTYVGMDVRTARSILTQSLGIIMIFIHNILP